MPSHLFQHDLLTSEFLPNTAFAPNSSWDLRADDSFVSVFFPVIPRQTLLLVQIGARLHSGGTYFVVLGRPRASTWKKLKDSEIQLQKAQLYVARVLIGLNNKSPSQKLGEMLRDPSDEGAKAQPQPPYLSTCVLLLRPVRTCATASQTKV